MVTVASQLKQEDGDAPSSEAEYGIRVSRVLKEVYKKAREQQRKVALCNKARLDKHKHDVSFEPGDIVTLWEPQAKEDKAKDKKKHKKLDFLGTGPWVITQKLGELSYEMVLVKNRMKTRKAHVNRITPFDVWSEGAHTTHLDYDFMNPERRAESNRLDKMASPGQFVCVVFNSRELPFRIGILQERRENKTLLIHWYGNKNNVLEGPYLPGYMQRGKAYFRKTKSHYKNKPYTTDISGPIKDDHVCAFGFDLTDDDKLSEGLLWVGLIKSLCIFLFTHD